MSAKELFPNVKTFLLDCDGLLWYNYQVINNANVSVKSLRNHGYNVYFVTNTTLKNSVEILEKLHHLRFEACQDEIFCPSLVMAHHLKSLNFQKSVYVIGYRSIISELNLVGINGYDDDDLIKIESTNPGTEIEIGAVIIGHDISYKDRKVHRAIKYLQCPETLYLSSGVHYGSNHVDPPVSTVGKTVEMIKESCSIMPELFAKPSSIMWDFILKRYALLYQIKPGSRNHLYGR
ncbi:Phosphoglycolate phosphatase 2 [Thelohanellus kitauei]|uniref:Phosphoglycolate phosphatase 2 n=1 Tax=Thelohanellus kitauei TaxID=669202 RepID=A0A0C2N5L5_THEKT|nr:Phosphoglycolate phosphatase 2 [Thelohanellus kitauei]